MSSAQTLNAFLKLYLEDQWSGKRRTLDEYVAMFPGHDAVIAERFAGLESDAHDAGAPAAGVPERIGPYRVVKELGRGGQGIVYFAEDERLHRMVALKVLTGLGSLAPGRVARFLREAEVASRLDHPGIATVYEIGTDGGFPFIAMRYVDGETLAARIGRGPRAGAAASDAVKETARMAEQAARALHAAHEAGIIHRDIKPGNILIQADGDPVIVDFGLAHDADAGLATLTMTGEFFGTPAYMSPEQIATQAARPDRRTDVWSLGATLYECLTFQRPFEAPTREQLYRAVLATEPANPRRLNESIPEDLAAIVEMALQKEVDRRYETAGAMADDLAAFVGGRPVAARRIGALGRFRRWTRREPAKAALLFFALVAFPVIAVLLTNYIGNREKVEAGRLAALQEAKDELLSRGAYEFGEGAPGRAIQWYEQAAAMEGGSPEAVAGIAGGLLTQERPAEAIAILDKNDDLMRGRWVASLVRARSLRALGREDEAVAIERSAPRIASALDFYLDGARLLDEGHAGRKAAFHEAIGQFRRAIYEAAAPRAIYYQGLAHAASHTRDATVAREVAPALLTHWPGSAPCAFWAGTALELVSSDEAIAALREAIRIRPDYAEAYCNLGVSQDTAGHVEDAMASQLEALRLRPDFPDSHYNLAVLLLKSGDLDGAIAHCREAIRLRPTHFGAHYDLGAALERKKLTDEAIQEYLAATRIDSWNVDARLSLALAFKGKGLIDEAISALRNAIRIQPSDARLHYNLGIMLRTKGLVAEAIATYREAIRLQPDHAEAHCNLGRALQRDGQLAAGLEELRKGHELGTRKPGWPYASDKWVEEAEDLVRRERRLLDVVSGKAHPVGAADLIGLADVAVLTRRWRLAVTWIEAALESDPKLGSRPEEWLLEGARAAAQAAAANEGESRPAAECARLRALALGWLQDEVRLQRDLVENGEWDEERLRRSLAELVADPAFASVRDQPGVSALGAEEAHEWSALWARLR